MKRHRFLVVGLGVLGQSVAQTLTDEGGEVIAVDKSTHLVDQVRDIVAVAAEADATDAKALEQLGASGVDAGVVCIGEEFQAAVLCTANLLDLGVPHVAARANTRMSESILKRVGAHDVFRVESLMGKRLAYRLRQPLVVREMEVGEGLRVMQWKVPEEIIGKPLAELNCFETHAVQLLGVRRASNDIPFMLPSKEMVFSPGDILLIAGLKKDISRLFSSI